MIIITLIIISGSLLIPKIVYSMAKTVKATKISNINYIDCVNATGEVVQKDKQFIKSSYPVVISEMLVDTGDSVKVGQAVANIDREATAQKIVNSSSYATMAGISSSELRASYQNAYSSIPAQIFSNADGIIESISANSGDYIEKNSSIASLVSNGSKMITVQVSENKISKIEIGQPVEITGSGFGDKIYYGYVNSISPTAKKAYIGINQETVIDVEISIDNPDNDMKLGYSAKARILTKPMSNINILPYETILQDDAGQEYVFVFNKGFAMRRDITTGEELPEGAQVLSGLDENDIIIVQGQNIISNGTLIRIVE